MPLLQIDAFTDTAFRGNPAAVCLLPSPGDATWMQSVAAEMNLAETAFVVPISPNHFGLRWFTPVTEVALCGHATLAGAHALWSSGRVQRTADITFETLSGPLMAQLDATTGRVTIDLPARTAREVRLPDVVARALSVNSVWSGVTDEGIDVVDYLIELPSERAVREAQPDIHALRSVACGVILTAASGAPDEDVVSRYFVPFCGIDEDPVTGSAHCVIATHWARVLGRSTLVARQASAREGLLHVRLVHDRVHLTGSAVTVFEGELLV